MTQLALGFGHRKGYECPDAVPGLASCVPNAMTRLIVSQISGTARGLSS